jgi:hypothetical protein
MSELSPLLDEQRTKYGRYEPFTMPSLPKYSVRHDESVCNSESLTPDAFGDLHFGPKQVYAGALSAGCQ